MQELHRVLYQGKTWPGREFSRDNVSDLGKIHMRDEERMMAEEVELNCSPRPAQRSFMTDYFHLDSVLVNDGSNLTFYRRLMSMRQEQQTLRHFTEFVISEPLA